MKFRHINRVIIFFLLFTTISLVIIWNFVNSSQFAGFLTRTLSGYISEHFTGKLEFNNIGVTMFPPGIEVKEVTLSYQSDGEEKLNLNVIASKVDIDFNIFNFSPGKYSINSIDLVDAIVQVDFESPPKEGDQKFSKEQLDEIVAKVKNDTYEINNIGIYDTSIKINQTSLFVDELYLSVDDKLQFLTSISEIEFGDEIPKIDVLIVQGELLEDKVYLEELSVTYLHNKLNFKGELEKIFAAEKMNIAGEYNYSGYLEEVMPVIKDLPEILTIDSAQVELNGTVNGPLDALKAKGNVLVKDIDTDFGKFKEVEGELSYSQKSGVLTIEAAQAQDYFDGKVSLTSEMPLYDIVNKKFVHQEHRLAANRVNLKNAMTAVPAVSSAVDGFISGDLILKIRSDVVEVELLNKFYASPLILEVNNNKILNIAKLSFAPTTNFIINTEGVKLLGTATDETSVMKYQGEITKEKISVQIAPTIFDVGRFSKVGDVELTGKGNFALTVEGKTSDPLMTFIFDDFQDASIGGYFLGHLKGNVVLDFATNEIELQKVSGNYADTQIEYTGKVKLDGMDLGVNVDIKNLNASILTKVINPVLDDNLKRWLSLLEGSFDGVVRLRNKISSPDFSIGVDFNSKLFKYYREDFFDLTAKFFYQKRKVIFKDIKFKKGSSNVSSHVEFDLDSKQNLYHFQSKNFSLKDLNVYSQLNSGFQSIVPFDLTIKEENHRTAIDGSIQLQSTKINGTKVESSILNFESEKGFIDINGSLFGNLAKIQSRLDTNTSNTTRSTLKMRGNFDTWSYFSNIFSNFDLDDSLMAGKFNFTLDSNFHLYDLKKMNVDFQIQDLIFSNYQLGYKITPNRNIIQIKNGEIQKWDLHIANRDNEYLASSATGNTENFKIRDDFQANLRKINVFLGTDYDFNGEISGRFDVFGSLDQPDYYFRASTENFSLSTKSLPNIIDQTKFSIEFKDNRLHLHRLLSRLGAGHFYANGYVELHDYTPKVNLNFNLKDADVKFNSKSDVTLRGSGSLIGEKAPYSLSGNFGIVSGRVYNDIDEFGDSSKISQNEIRFLPEKIGSLNQSLVNLNLSVITDRAVHIKNSLIDMRLAGNLSVSGNAVTPQVLGRITTPTDGINNIYFKNNTFNVKRFFVTFDGSEDYKNPLLDVQASSTISEYKVDAKVLGTVKNFNFELTSDPYLPRQSILSLIAFGYAENMSEYISDSDKESLSSAGIGGFIFDQLKINEKLQDNLGVQLNIGTEFAKSNRSYLEGRTSKGGGVGSVRSSAKVELRKKITTAMSLSVSSTVGGSIGQKQSMNLNYQLNNNMSVEGVYEVRTTEEGEQTLNSTSAGADMKFNWTFK